MAYRQFHSKTTRCTKICQLFYVIFDTIKQLLLKQRKKMSSLTPILKNDFGAGAVEYALLISLLSVGFALALAASGESLCGLNERVSQIFLTGTDILSTCRPGSGNGNSSSHSNANANPNA